MLFDFVSGDFNKYYYNKFNQKKRIHYVVMPPRRGTVTVSVTTEDNVTYDCKYRYLDKMDLYEKIVKGEPLNLDYVYISDFDITEIYDHEEYPLISFSSSYSFWDGHVNFDHAVFDDGGVCFDHATFGDGDTNFYNTKFGNGAVSFRHMNFGVGEVNFNYASFGTGDVQFHQAQFGEGNVSFVGTDFGSGGVFFTNADLGIGDLDFIHTKAERILFIENTFLSHTNLLFDDLKELVLQDCIIEKIMKIAAVPYQRLSFLHTANLGQIYLAWKKGNILHAIENGYRYDAQQDSCMPNPFTHEERALQFRMLKENFRNIGEYENEDRAYRAYMKYSTMHFPRNFLKVFGFISGYGTSPVRVFLTTIVTVLLFAVGYSQAFTLAASGERFAHIFLKGIYFSATTFLTIGYGDIQPPTQAVAFFASIEGFLGLFLMSYFTVAIVRKLLR